MVNVREKPVAIYSGILFVYALMAIYYHFFKNPFSVFDGLNHFLFLVVYVSVCARVFLHLL